MRGAQVSNGGSLNVVLSMVAGGSAPVLRTSRPRSAVCGRTRCWNALAQAPPPPALAALLEALRSGTPINVYLPR